MIKPKKNGTKTAGKPIKNNHRGSSFDEFLATDGTLVSCRREAVLRLAYRSVLEALTEIHNQFPAFQISLITLNLSIKDRPIKKKKNKNVPPKPNQKP